MKAKGPWLARFRGRIVWGYAIALTTAILATAFRAWLGPWLPAGFPFITYFPAIIITAYVAGWGPGTLCAGVSTVAAWYCFISPENTFQINDTTALAIAFFGLVVAFIIRVIHQMQRALERLAEEQAETNRLYEQQKVMFQEMQHRVANNMMFVSSLLMLHRRRAQDNPAHALTALDEAQERLSVISRIHRRLYDPSRASEPVDQYFNDMIHEILQASGASNISSIIRCEKLTIELTTLTTLSLVVAEIVTNSIKHAFKGRERGSIEITLVKDTGDHVVLTIKDDGVGFNSEAANGHGSGLGQRIVTALVRQIGGSMTVDSVVGQGTTTQINFSVN